MKSVREINEMLDHIESHMFPNSKCHEVIKLLRNRMCRLNMTEEILLTEKFTKETFIESLPFVVHSLNFFKVNSVNLPLHFKQDLVLNYINSFEQLASSTEDIFVNPHKHTNVLYPFSKVIHDEQNVEYFVSKSNETSI